MPLQAAIGKLAASQDLSGDEMSTAMELIMGGQASAAQIGGFLVALRMKGETVAEITAAARVMRDLSETVAADPRSLVDTCGTGGDGAGTFNVSTTSALVVAAAGGRVAKHGNRGVSSRSGSADLLEAAGVNIALTPAQVNACITEIGIGFMFAPAHHQAMRHAVAPRRELGIRTLFNLLGPLTNPAGARAQLIGVFQARWTEPLAEASRNLGSSHVMVVHGEDGLDEISIGAPTRVTELRDGAITSYSLSPEQFGFGSTDLGAIKAGDTSESLARMRSVLDNDPGPALDIVLLNAGAALYVCGVARDISAGIDLAREALAQGNARRKLEQLIKVTNAF
ncbi:MAG: anthranilate phosphoribosyltransferase [Gammaproteobacteria bacterium]